MRQQQQQQKTKLSERSSRLCCKYIEYQNYNCRGQQQIRKVCIVCAYVWILLVVAVVDRLFLICDPVCMYSGEGSPKTAAKHAQVESACARVTAMCVSVHSVSHPRVLCNDSIRIVNQTRVTESDDRGMGVISSGFHSIAVH